MSSISVTKIAGNNFEVTVDGRHIKVHNSTIGNFGLSENGSFLSREDCASLYEPICLAILNWSWRNK